MLQPALVGDIGGTNARFALVTPGQFDLHEIRTYLCKEYPTIFDAVRHYLTEVGNIKPTEACLAFACPVHQDIIKMTNNPWTFSKTEFRQIFQLTNFKAINDFTAMALGIPQVPASELHQIGNGHNAADRVRLVMGPGTGLGVAGLVPSQRYWIPLSSEGGHASFAPTDMFEMKLLDWFFARYGRVSTERILCGQGLVDLYLAYCEFRRQVPQYSTPAEVTKAALSSEQSMAQTLAYESIMRFCSILGHTAGDIALTLGARGGIYLCGGILPRILPLLEKSRFRETFADKGRMGYYTADIQTWVVKAQQTGLLGAAEALHNEEVN